MKRIKGKELKEELKGPGTDYHKLFMALVIIIPIPLVLCRALGIRHDFFAASRAAWPPAFVPSWLRSSHRSVNYPTADFG